MQREIHFNDVRTHKRQLLVVPGVVRVCITLCECHADEKLEQMSPGEAHAYWTLVSARCIYRNPAACSAVTLSKAPVRPMLHNRLTDALELLHTLGTGEAINRWLLMHTSADVHAKSVRLHNILPQHANKMCQLYAVKPKMRTDDCQAVETKPASDAKRVLSITRVVVQICNGHIWQACKQV